MMPGMERTPMDCSLAIDPGHGIGPLRLGGTREDLATTAIAGRLPEAAGAALIWPGIGLTASFDDRGSCLALGVDTGKEHGPALATGVAFTLDGVEVQALPWSAVDGLLAGRALDLVASASPSLGLFAGRYERDDEWVGYWRVQPPVALVVPLLAGRGVGCIRFGMSRAQVRAMPAMAGAVADGEVLSLQEHGLSVHFAGEEGCVAIDAVDRNPADTGYRLQSPVPLTFTGHGFDEIRERCRRSRVAGGLEDLPDGFLLPEQGLRARLIDGRLHLRLVSPGSGLLRS